jgi:hypothetical protein
MCSLAVDVGVEHDHRREKANLFRESSGLSKLGVRLNLSNWPPWNGFCNVRAVSKLHLRLRRMTANLNISVASCALFGVLAAVDRPFEAHLFKHGYQQCAEACPTPCVSRRPSIARPTSYAEKRPMDRRRSVSTHRSNPSIATIDLSNSPAPSTIFAPSPVQSLGLGIFTSHHAPPPIPPAYFAPTQNSLTRPPRLSGHVATPGFVPLVQYSASTWRAVHPTGPPTMLPASRSQPYLPNTGSSYYNRYSRSSVSLTRPHRLSYTTPALSSSSRSGSTGPEGRDSPLSGEVDASGKATANEIAYAILNETPIPGTTRPEGRDGHVRTASAPDATSGAQQPSHSERMAIGWKPQLPDLDLGQKHNFAEKGPIKVVKLVHSSSEGFLSRFSPVTSPDDNLKKPHQELEKELDARLITRKPVPLRSRSADPMRYSSAPSVAEAVAAMVSNMPT